MIREARRFLAEHPASAARLTVTFAAAQAYETWWSLSQSAVDTYTDWVAYRAGAEQARRRAIALYAEIARQAPGGAEAREAARELPRLRLGLDTAQRRFFCIYD